MCRRSLRDEGGTLNTLLLSPEYSINTESAVNPSMGEMIKPLYEQDRQTKRGHRSNEKHLLSHTAIGRRKQRIPFALLILKLRTGRLVAERVTVSEYRLLYVFDLLLPFALIVGSSTVNHVAIWKGWLWNWVGQT